MKKIFVHPYKVYGNRKEEPVIFNEANLVLAKVTPMHLFVLRALRRYPDNPEKLDVALKKEHAKEALQDLEDLGFIARREEAAKCKLCFTALPRISAFRIALTEECNLGCPECFVTKCRENLKTMTKEVLARVIEETISFGKERALTYHFFGGEPLIRFSGIKQAVKRIDEAVRSGEMMRPTFAITTNLTLLNDEMISFFKRHDFKVGVSVDGPEKMNDKFRMYKDGRGCFKDVRRNYLRLVEAGIDAYILITPHPDALEKLPFIFREVIKAFPIKTLTVNTPFHFRTLAWNVDGKAYAAALVKLTGEAQKRGITVDSALSPVLYALSSQERRGCPCMFNGEGIMASVNPNGKISFCSQNWNDILLTDIRRKVRIPVQMEEECLRREARNICGGPCPAHQLISGKTIDKQKCRFMRQIIKEIALNLEIFSA